VISRPGVQLCIAVIVVSGAIGMVLAPVLRWVRTELATLPNGTEGWLPVSALGGWSFLDTRVVVDRAKLRLTLFRGAHAIFRAPIAIGTPIDPTAAGRFYIRDRFSSFSSPMLGKLMPVGTPVTIK
jgi:hypothetical protein